MPKLTQRTVEAATCPPGRKDVLMFDTEVVGFGMRVTAAGSKVFLAQHNTPAGKRRIKLGAFGVLTVEEARKRARAVLGDAAEGRDPFAERRAAGEALKAAEAAARASEVEAAYTFAKLVDGWKIGRLRANRRVSYLTIATAAMKRHFADWLERPASSITTAEAVRVLDTIRDEAGGTAANRAFSYARAAFGWALSRQAIARNPMAGIERPAGEASRDRVLSMAEVAAVWNAAPALPGAYGPFVRVLLLTLQRRNEVAGMRWDELAADFSTWTLPAERAKNGRAHIVHLAAPVRAILCAVSRIKGSPFVFRAETGNPVSAFSHAKREIDAAIAKARTEAGQEPVALPAWTMHDFRRSGVTALADMGFPPHVADRLLNHLQGTIKGVAAVYQRAEFLTERKAALDAWATRVIAAAEGTEPAGNVVTLARPG